MSEQPYLYKDVQGIDVSYHQGKIRWEIVALRVDFAYIRACYGTKEDSEFKRNWEQSDSYGIPRGAYCYFLPTQSPVAQAEKFASLIGTFGPDGKYQYSGSPEELEYLPPMLDVEEQRPWFVLGKNAYDYTLAVTQFVDHFEAITGIQVGVYTSPGFWNKWILPNTWAYKLALWVAHWTNAALPLLPNDWKMVGGRANFWQYAVLKDGKEYGMESYGLDHDRWRYSKSSWMDAPEPDEIPDGVFPRYRVAVDTLNLRDGPDGKIIGKTTRGAVWETTGAVTDGQGRVWLQSGPTVHLASWLTEIVE